MRASAQVRAKSFSRNHTAFRVDANVTDTVHIGFEPVAGVLEKEQGSDLEPPVYAHPFFPFKIGKRKGEFFCSFDWSLIDAKSKNSYSFESV